MKNHMEYTFISETKDLYHDIVRSRVTVEVNPKERDDLFAEFGSFLKACGYRIDGEVTVVPFDEEE